MLARLQQPLQQLFELRFLLNSAIFEAKRILDDPLQICFISALEGIAWMLDTSINDTQDEGQRQTTRPLALRNEIYIHSWTLKWICDIIVPQTTKLCLKGSCDFSAITEKLQVEFRELPSGWKLLRLLKKKFEVASIFMDRDILRRNPKSSSMLRCTVIGYLLSKTVQAWNASAGHTSSAMTSTDLLSSLDWQSNGTMISDAEYSARQRLLYALLQRTYGALGHCVGDWEGDVETQLDMLQEQVQQAARVLFALPQQSSFFTHSRSSQWQLQL
jgi:hypothetical protein